ncbi:hypothetical protein JZM28_17610 [Enterobacter hormaechei]|uniref:hypothetical protein n=1 Tax=Enterobacter cloacae complex TaxID=354276 RepID=UPI00197DAEAE|nr:MULTISPECIES: hypothetical protein [Enterobacter cloacae complex]MCU2955312.1 hypothetical protein [Enterobacter hormaechei subsp. hoffmannii]MCU3660926.1 hypothetical protein [Enterobacter hormaechei subsp. steigerwaltii]MBK4302992.1 hypothetical protein [Enterobacter hormaechei]MBN6402160.1 hypothetical protein [Enterobacter hormaechei]MCU3793273.1 hypothetical protein [Enterobacter hormaechei subsp. steigerwaltii]
MEFTVEQLMNAIRSADSLEELKRLVGASDEEEAEFTRMLREQESIGDKYNWNVDSMPPHIRDKFVLLGSQINLFEANYR